MPYLHDSSVHLFSNRMSPKIACPLESSVKPKPCLQDPPIRGVGCSVISIAKWLCPLWQSAFLLWAHVGQFTDQPWPVCPVFVSDQVQIVARECYHQTHFKRSAFCPLEIAVSLRVPEASWVMLMSHRHCAPWSMPIHILFLDRNQQLPQLHSPNQSRSS